MGVVAKQIKSNFTGISKGRVLPATWLPPSIDPFKKYRQDDIIKDTVTGRKPNYERDKQRAGSTPQTSVTVLTEKQANRAGMTKLGT